MDILTKGYTGQYQLVSHCETCKSVVIQKNIEGGITMENAKMIENRELENKEENKPGIVEVEVNCDNGLVFFGTCHCSVGSKLMLF